MFKKFIPPTILFVLFLCVFAGEVCAQNDYLETFLAKDSNAIKFLNHPESEKRLAKARQVNQILQEMSLMRNNFLQMGDFTDIFPTVYYHVTVNEFEMILSDKLENPLEIMDLIINFYEIYKINRQAFLEKGVEAVQPQWRQYYFQAIKANEYRRKPAHIFKPLRMLWKTKNILQSGFKGHINIDLPIAIKKTLQTTNTSPDNIYKDFRRSDAVMLKADSLANQDISLSIFKRNRLFAKLSLNFGEQLFSVMPKVMKMRIKAWNAVQ